MSNDEVLRKWRRTMKKLDFVLDHECNVADEDGNFPEWFTDWQEELNTELAIMERDYPHLLELAALEDKD